MNDFKIQKIPIDFERNIWNVNWSPDGNRLIFFHDNYGGGREHDLWSMNLDGSDLKPMLAMVEEFKVISNIR
jgi:Tol biopolymer transport system component